MTVTTSSTQSLEEFRSILVFQPNQQPALLLGSDRPQVLPDITLELSVATIFSWLKMSSNQ